MKKHIVMERETLGRLTSSLAAGLLYLVMASPGCGVRLEENNREIGLGALDSAASALLHLGFYDQSMGLFEDACRAYLVGDNSDAGADGR